MPAADNETETLQIHSASEIDIRLFQKTSENKI